MKYVFAFFKHILTALLLFWCPWGRASRAAYRAFLAFSFCAAFTLAYLNSMARTRPGMQPWVYAGLAWALLSLYMAAVRRGHDLGFSGWYTLAHFWRFTRYPYQVLAGEEGEKAPNRYGSAPKD